MVFMQAQRAISGRVFTHCLRGPQGLYVHTAKNVLIQISPHVRLPRTFRRFCGLMVQLLQKMSIRATNGPDKLLKVIVGGGGGFEREGGRAGLPQVLA